MFHFLFNSLWGRFSMRNNMASCELITDPSRFTQLMFSDHYDVRQFCFISDETAMVQWRHTDARGSRIKDVNIFVGAMTTAYARMMLYDLLEGVPPLGPYLGDLTDKLNEGDVCGLTNEDLITEFISGDPKCYAYRTRQGKTQMKCKGATLNGNNAAVVTHESLLGLVKSFMSDRNTPAHVTTKTETISRDKKRFHLKNETVWKKVKVVYDKRRVLPDFTTLPYGY